MVVEFKLKTPLGNMGLYRSVNTVSILFYRIEVLESVKKYPHRPEDRSGVAAGS